MNWYNYVGSDPINATDPTGLLAKGCYPRPGSRIPDCSDRQKIKDHFDSYGFRDLTSSQIDSAVDLAAGTGTRSAAFAAFGVENTDAGSSTFDGDVIVVTANRVRLDVINANTLWDHYLNGNGATVCLSFTQFIDAAGYAKLSGSALPHRENDTQTVRTASFYDTPLENTYGTASIILDSNNLRVGFYDYYDFDLFADRDLSGHIKTIGGGIAGVLQGGGNNFDINYNNRICGR